MKNLLRKRASGAVHGESISGTYASGNDRLKPAGSAGGLLSHPLPQPYPGQKNGKRRIWIDLINPSDVLFFNALMHDLSDCQISVTFRERAETVNLGHSFGIEGAIVGRDSIQPAGKVVLMGLRTVRLFGSTSHFDCSMSFENGMSALISRLRGKTSFQFCDNDLKFIQKTSRYQDLETKIKLLSDYLVVPRVCAAAFGKYVDDSRLIVYDGYKENVYIADYTPDPRFLERVPFEQYVVVRPEALDAFYVKDKYSIVPQILKGLVREGQNVVYLPRTGSDRRYAEESSRIFIPNSSLNGLDLCNYADAVFTGSGTMAREAACMGRKSVSFFPGDHLLSVDRQLVDDKRILHSRDPEEIVAYGLENGHSREPVNVEASLAVKQSIVRQLRAILSNN